MQYGGDQTAVGGQGRTDEVGGIVRGQERDRRCDLGRRAEPSGGRPGRNRLPPRVQGALEPTGVDETRRHRIDADALDDQFLRGRPGETQDARLGRGIVGMAMLTITPVPRPDIDRTAARVQKKVPSRCTAIR